MSNQLGIPHDYYNHSCMSFWYSLHRHNHRSKYIFLAHNAHAIHILVHMVQSHMRYLHILLRMYNFPMDYIHHVHCTFGFQLWLGIYAYHMQVR